MKGGPPEVVPAFFAELERLEREGEVQPEEPEKL